MLLLCLASACRSDHHVSPWPQDLGLETLAQPPDLAAQLARIDKEMANEQLEKIDEVEGAFSDHSRFVLRGYAALDRLGRQRSAIRAATGYGVVLALGPRDPADLTRSGRTRLVVALADGGGWRSGTDLNGDGHPDVVVQGEDGTLELWYLLPKGASPYAVRAIVLPDHAVDIDEDGRPDPAARVKMGSGDVLRPDVIEVATFQDGAYRNDTQACKAWHARLAAVQDRSDAGADAGMATLGTADALRGAIERAWHAIRSGQPCPAALEQAEAVAAARAPLGPGVAQAWVRWRGWLAEACRSAS